MNLLILNIDIILQTYIINKLVLKITKNMNNFFYLSKLTFFINYFK